MNFIPGFVVATTGYPEEVISECIPPNGYPDTWSYNIWRKGQWTNTANVTLCIDPNLCYNDPPGMKSNYAMSS